MAAIHKALGISMIHILVFCGFPLPSSTFSDYGESCNKTVRCESGAYLSCQNETCKCIKPDSMIYENQLKTCVTLTGEKCRYSVSNNEDGQSSYLFETVPCVAYATCLGERGVCTCLPDFVDHKNGTCSLKGGFNAECQSQSDCRFDLALNCVNNSCQCDSENSVDSFFAFKSNFTRQRQCLGLAGKPCLHQKCTPNAVCPEIYFGPNTPPICQCIPPYTITQQGLCLAGHGVSCNNVNPCSDEFLCIDGRCQCKYPLHQVFDQYSWTCKSLVWGPCDIDKSDRESNSNMIQCVSGATCVQTAFNNFTRCECGQDFIENDQGECDLTFGSSCENSVFIQCDKLASLTCRSGKCGCPDNMQIYDSSTRKCKGLVGSICSTDDSCVSKATCEINKDSLGRPGGRRTCGCTEGSLVTSNRNCN